MDINTTQQRKPTTHSWWLMIISIFAILAVLIIWGKSSFNTVMTTTSQHDEWLKPAVNKPQATPTTMQQKIKAGDTAILVLGRLGFPMLEALNIIQATKPVYALRHIRVGNVFQRSDSPRGLQLRYEIDAATQLVMTYHIDQGWKTALEARHVSNRTVTVQGTIQHSLFLAAAKAGMSDTLTMKLVDMFAWDIDFARDLRKGDMFKVMFEEAFDDQGKRVYDKIIAAEFYNKGQVFTGIRYTNAKGDSEYFSQEGQNLRKTYLKSPVKYSRISSRFSRSRKHPVLGYTRAHRGVDYAAKSGTPIRAVGDGKVVFKGWKGGYGRFVEIKHNNGIHSTAYAHMRRYGKGIRKGRAVHQGQILGYVGMSGLATGPHLHFEFRSRGRAVNPLKVKHKPANPVAKQEMTAFRIQAKALLKELNQQTQLNTWG